MRSALPLSRVEEVRAKVKAKASEAKAKVRAAKAKARGRRLLVSQRLLVSFLLPAIVDMRMVVIANSAILVPALASPNLRPNRSLSEVRQLQLGLKVRRSVPGKRTSFVKRICQAHVIKIIRLVNTAMPKS